MVTAARDAACRAMDMARKEHARLVLVFQFDAGKGEKDPGRGSDFSQSFELANFLSGDELNGVPTRWPICRSRSKGMPCCR